MATIVLSAAGFAAGASIGGTALGLSSAVIGRAIGATVGRVIDQRLLGSGSDAVETGRVERFRLTGASEGAGIAQVYGRMRISGQVIWAIAVPGSCNHQRRRQGYRRRRPDDKFQLFSQLGNCALRGRNHARRAGLGRRRRSGPGRSKSSGLWRLESLKAPIRKSRP